MEIYEDGEGNARLHSESMFNTDGLSANDLLIAGAGSFRQHMLEVLDLLIARGAEAVDVHLLREYVVSVNITDA